MRDENGKPRLSLGDTEATMFMIGVIIDTHDMVDLEFILDRFDGDVDEWADEVFNDDITWFLDQSQCDEFTRLIIERAVSEFWKKVDWSAVLAAIRNEVHSERGGAE